MKKHILFIIGSILMLATLLFWIMSNSVERQNSDVLEHKNTTSEQYVLAVSWQPAFCETRPNRPECRSQHEKRFDASNFSLHGLWPQPAGDTYCGIAASLVKTDKSGKWKNLPRLELSQGIRKKLSEKMPGYRSYLHRHEWIKHGSCMHGFSPEEYFQISIKLLDSLNTSALAEYFRSNIGSEISLRKVAQLADRSFGKGAGKRVEMDCYRISGRRIMGQLEFSLSGNINENSDFASLLTSGVIEQPSCPSGIIDRVGLQ